VDAWEFSGSDTGESDRIRTLSTPALHLVTEGSIFDSAYPPLMIKTYFAQRTRSTQNREFLVRKPVKLGESDDVPAVAS
jgi:hypothetical protein